MISNGCGVDPIAVSKRKTDEGVRKELQDALHYGLEYRLGIGRRTANNVQNIGSRGLLLERFVQLTAKARNISSLSCRREIVPVRCLRGTALLRRQPLATSRFGCFVAPSHCLPRGSAQDIVTV